MKRRAVLAAVLAALFCLGFFTLEPAARAGSPYRTIGPCIPGLGCFGDAIARTEAAGGESSSTKRRLVVYGGDRDFPPYEWLDELGKPRGFNIDLMRAIAAGAGFDVAFELDRWDLIRHGFEVEERIDVTDMYWSEERAKTLDYAQPYRIVYDEVWIRKDGREISDIRDLEGMTVLVQKSAYTEEYLRGSGLGVIIKGAASEIAALSELARGEGDCALVTEIAGREAVRHQELRQLRRTGPPLLPRSFGLVVRKGEDGLLALINAGLAQIKKSGEYDELERRWFVEDDGIPTWRAVARRYLWWVLGVVAAIVLGVVAWTRSLRRQVAARTRELNNELAEHLKTEEALRRSEQKFAIAFKASPSLMALSTPEDGRYLEVNGAFVDITGYSREEAIGRTSIDLGLWSNPGDRIELRGRLASQGSVRNFETRIRIRSGESRDVLMGADIVEIEGCKQYLTLVTDITDRKRTEAALRHSEERWKFALEGSGDGVWDADPRMNRVYGSRRYKEILGYMDGDWVHDPLKWRERVHPEDMAEIHRRYEAHLKGETPAFVAEVRLRRKDGSFVWTLVRGKALSRDANGRYQRTIGTVTDITERRRIDAEHAALEEQLRQVQKMEAIGQLAAGIAHDFNNQLTVIQGYCELLLGRELPADESVLLVEIQKAAARSASLTSKLLAFGRKQVRRPVVMNLNHVLSELTGPISRMIGEQIRMNIDAASDLGNVRADRSQVEQVILNIAVNARDAMEGGGTLTIRTRNIDIDEAYVARHMDASLGPHVALYFRDTGMGMDDSVVRRMFEPFFTTKDVGQGTGLGLPIVYGIIRQSGGHLTVETSPGKGTEIGVVLPMVDEDVSDENAVHGQVSDRPQTGRILFVEDDPGLFLLLSDVLQRAGFHAVSTRDPVQAAELFGTLGGPLDLLVTDVMMPGMNGPELVKILREKQPGLRVLYISGYPRSVVNKHGTLPEGIQLLGKPFTPALFLKTIQEMLESPG
jgi:PAS domain S-box-containing protein